MTFLYALLSVVVVSLLSLLGALFLILRRKVFEQLITYTLAFSSGVLLATAFLDVIPESLSVIPQTTFYLTLVGIVVFFAVEKFMHWHHHVEGDNTDEEKVVAYLSLTGDSIHNFVDGVIIAASFIVSVPLGITTTLAVIAHEIPHELSDFTILIYGGFSNKKALFYNFLSALTAVLGTVVMFLVSTQIGNEVAKYMLPFAAGNFIYIALTDLIPELHKKRRLGTSLGQIALLLLGIIVIDTSMRFLGAK